MAGRAKQAGKRESKTFSSLAWHLVSFVQQLLEDKPFLDPTAKRLAVANSAVPLSITAAHISPVGTFAGVFYQEDSSNEWSCSFSFHLTSPNFCPSVTVGTNDHSHLNHGVDGLDP